MNVSYARIDISNNSRKLNGLLSLFLIIFSSFSESYNQDFTSWKYELEGIQQGVDGTYLLKVWVYSRTPGIDYDLAKKMAVHGVIFKGYSGRKGLSSQPPLTENLSLEEEEKSFFKIFFSNNGRFNDFVNLSDKKIGPGDRLKLGKREYKIGLVASVKKDALRKYLENSGIIKRLSDGF